jgi:hypothetical protein
MQHARGDFITLLNNDAVAHTHWLDELIQAAQRHPEAGFFASQVVLYSAPHLLESAGDGFSAAGTVFRRGHLREAAAYPREEYVFGAQGCAAFYRRELLDKIGLFDEDFFLVYEDADLSFRAQLAGYKCLYVPSATVYHHGGSTIGRFSELYVYQSQRNVEYVFLKDLPTALLLQMQPAHLVYNLLGFVFFASHGQMVPFLRAKYDAIRMIPSLLKKRRHVLSNIQVPVSYIKSQVTPEWLPRIIYEKMRQSLK